MIEVTYAGAQTLIVSEKRHGMERFGVPTGGPADLLSSRLANRLVGNSDGCALLEMTLMPAELLFHEPCSIACAGGACTLRLTRAGETRVVPMNETLRLRAGDKLRGEFLKTGLRLYLAVSGGIEGEMLRPTPLRRGDRLRFAQGSAEASRRLAARPRPIPERFFLLRAIRGTHIDAFSRAGVETFLTGVFTYRQDSNRMGIRFDGEKVAFAAGNDGNIISEGMMPGDIQISSDGAPIMMLADCQTIGGYAKIAHLIAADLPVAAQLRPGDRVRFRFVTVEEAQDALVGLEKDTRAALRCSEAPAE